jgi:sRNA-binding carbon storage regulator CsrA
VLVLTRKPGQIVEIKPDPSLDPATPVGELFAHGPIEVIALTINGSQVKLGISADMGFLILRREREDRAENNRVRS